jgi:hypothetical protein
MIVAHFNDTNLSSKKVDIWKSIKIFSIAENESSLWTWIDEFNESPNMPQSICHVAKQSSL